MKNVFLTLLTFLSICLSNAWAQNDIIQLDSVVYFEIDSTQFRIIEKYKKLPKCLRKKLSNGNKSKLFGKSSYDNKYGFVFKYAACSRNLFIVGCLHNMGRYAHWEVILFRLKKNEIESISYQPKIFYSNALDLINNLRSLKGKESSCLMSVKQNVVKH